MKFILSIVVLFVLFQNLCILIGSTFTNSTTTRTAEDCVLYLNEESWLKTRRPLLMQQNSNKFVIASEVSKNKYGVSFESGESIRLACSVFENKHSKLINTDQGERLACSKSENEFSEFVNDENVDEAIATCDSDIWFNILGQTCNIYDIICENPIERKEIRTRQNCWGGAGVLLQIGFETSQRFIDIIDVCHDTETQNTYYTKFILTPNTGAEKGETDQYWFTNPDLFKDLDVNDLYSKHETNIREFLSDTEHIYFSDKLHVLSRGHLAAQGDFSYLVQRQATYTYSNTAPQWQTLNFKNWMTMETEITKFATKHKLDLDIYTGTYGIDQLINLETNELKDLYLNIERDVNGNVEKLSIPVPRIFWKIVYSPSTSSKQAQAIVFLGINSPYVTDQEINIPEDSSSTTSMPLTTTNIPDIEDKDIISKYRICKDICYEQTIGWGKIWKRNKMNIKMGYSYCCEVNEFLKKVQYLDIPGIHNAGILPYV